MMEPMIIPLAALAIPIIVAPTAMVFKHAMRIRELEHKERMRALELGAILPQDQPWWTPTRLVVLLVGLIPLGALTLGSLASSWQSGHGASEAIWLACGAVAVSGVIGGTYLARRYLVPSTQVIAPSMKSAHDPDAFDVVGSRGYSPSDTSLN